MKLVFGDAGMFWLLAGVALLVVIDGARRWAPRRRRVVAGLVRALVLGCLVLALADPRWQRQRDASWVVFVVDRSASIPDAGVAKALERVEALRAGLAPEVRVGLVFADKAPAIAVMPGQPWTVPSDTRGPNADSTDLGSALDLARALVPEGDAGQIVLLSDGRPTTGERTAEALATRARGLPIHVVTIAPERGDAAVTAVVLDEPLVRPGATTTGRIELDGGAKPFKGKVVVKVGDKIVKSEPIEIDAGKASDVPFEYSPELGTAEGPLAVAAELVPDGASEPSARSSTTLVVGSRPKVLVLAGDQKDGELLTSALRAEEMDVISKPLDTERIQSVPDDVDLVVLANAPAASVAGTRGLTDELLTNLAKYVDAGGGLIVVGGSRAFDLGGYAGTPIERVLPVRLDPVDPLVEPAATIVVVLDKSGSMSVPVSTAGGGSKSKMELADEGVVASLQLLRPFDYVAVASVTTRVDWDVTLQPVSDALDLESKILRIRSEGGGIFVYTGMEAAHKVLRDSTTPLRHLLLFSDCADSEEQESRGSGKSALTLAAEMKADGITTSVIGIGTEMDQDTQFLKDLAERGGGKFYVTDDATKLRALFVEETERLVDSSVQEVEFSPAIAARHKMIEGIDYEAGPKLTAYQKLEPRKTAEILLRAPENDPLLVTWRYGLGHVVAWSSDAGARWAKTWVDWPGYRRHWTQVARFSLRTRAGDATAVEVDMGSGQPVARVVRRDPAGATLEGRVKLRLKSGKRDRELSLTAREPGLYEAKLDVPPNAVHVLEVVDEEGKVISEHSFVLPPSEEQRHRTADEPFLTELATRTAGTVEPAALTAALRPSTTPDPLKLWPFAALLAALLLPLDAYLRRTARAV